MEYCVLVAERPHIYDVAVDVLVQRPGEPLLGGFVSIVQKECMMLKGGSL